MTELWNVKSTITGKRQITVPIRVYKQLELSVGDQVVFRYDGNNITVSAEKEKQECFTCHGTGNLSGKTCFICDGTGTIKAGDMDNAYKIIGLLMHAARLYKIHVIMENKDSVVPVISIKSDNYLSEDLKIVRDKIQSLIIIDYLNQFGSSDLFNEDTIISLLDTNDAKLEIKELLKKYR